MVFFFGPSGIRDDEGLRLQVRRSEIRCVYRIDSPLIVGVGGAPPRFPLGATVECRLGENRWAVGQVVGHEVEAFTTVKTS